MDKKNVLAMVLKGYPRLSETFIAQEILGLERAGLPLEISVRKQHEVSSRFLDDHFERYRTAVAFLPDTFGHLSQMPQILGQAGIDPAESTGSAGATEDTAGPEQDAGGEVAGPVARNGTDGAEFVVGIERLAEVRGRL